MFGGAIGAGVLTLLLLLPVLGGIAVPLAVIMLVLVGSRMARKRGWE